MIYYTSFLKKILKKRETSLFVAGLFRDTIEGVILESVRKHDLL